MSYSFLADATAAVHFLTVLAVVVGLLVAFRYKRFRPWEAGALLAVVLLWSYYGNCPFTILEEHFRNLAGEHTTLTQVGFLPYYAKKFLNISLTSRIIQRSTFFTGGVLFAASIEWFSPLFHIELFRARRLLRRLFAKKRPAKAGRYRRA